MSDYLEQFESFDEYEDKPLFIDNKSGIYLILFNGNKYIAWEKVNFATNTEYNDKSYLEMQKSFFNVINGEFILNTYELFDLDTNKREIIKPDGIVIIPLDEKLDLKKSESTVLSREKVLELTRNSK